MSVEKFIRRNAVVTQCLSRIAEHDDARKLLGPSLRFDVDIRELLSAQERLLNAAEHVLERCCHDDRPS